MQAPPLDLLPPEILDEIIQFLYLRDMMRFCRAVPRLNAYASIIYDAPSLFQVWPNPIMTSSMVPSIITRIPALQRLMAVVAGFGRATELVINTSDSDVTPDHIGVICSVLSNNVLLHINRTHHEAATVWLEQLEIHSKLILRLSVGHANETQSSHDLDKISQIIVDVNPRHLSFLYGSRLLASFESLLLQMQMLTDITLKYPEQDTCLKLIRVLPNSAIKRVEILFLYSVSNHELIELDGKMRKVGFVSRKSQSIQSIRFESGFELAHDTIRFCRAVHVWPNMTLYMRSIPVIVQHRAAVGSLGTLISRFNGTTCFDIPINSLFNVTSKKIIVIDVPFHLHFEWRSSGISSGKYRVEWAKVNDIESAGGFGKYPIADQIADSVMNVLKMTVTSICSLPVELLDEILKHLTTHDMIRFCRVMPVLTEYVDIIVKAGKLLNSTSGMYSWPDMKLSKRTIPILLQHKKAIAALGTLISRFNGVTRFEIAEDFPLDQIQMFCDVSSRNVCLMFGALGSLALRNSTQHFAA
ncbi:hypothetical protein BCR33DRAFT_789806 [Rhizoclosmatium globosum]|uniref:F-box domain-containing protein n=1 Tax=Rhizoclosmatium globosum TaxID=329046 RepID=A0A1Y2BR48_9FUNG|nr:hypothetical protein BCR33DRAFT_789806 [Rhizoclosmatium globosum]|eukprot:ORY37228.1 hypothetical protein BCR33DRAFT_789806 [Rhizoclosmatium globosum]